MRALLRTSVVPPTGITLSVTAYKVKSARYADLAWNETTRTMVDVYRNGSKSTTTPDDGAYTDKPPKTVSSATYKVCNAGTTNCSNEVTVTW